MPVLLASAVSAEERPLELLFACHEKVRRFTTMAGQLAAHIQEGGVDAEARQAATNILRYFDLALPNHHADEEEDVFPALRGLGDVGLNDAMNTLSFEHNALDERWQSSISPWLRRIAQGDDAGAAPPELAQFILDYLAHADREEREVFSAIERLSADVVEAVAQRMRARRGA